MVERGGEGGSGWRKRGERKRGGGLTLRYSWNDNIYEHKIIQFLHALQSNLSFLFQYLCFLILFFQSQMTITGLLMNHYIVKITFLGQISNGKQLNLNFWNVPEVGGRVGAGRGTANVPFAESEPRNDERGGRRGEAGGCWPWNFL